MLLEALETHFPSMSLINFSKNKINKEGAKLLAIKIPLLKKMVHLNLSHNVIGDQGCIDIVQAVNTYSSLTQLHLNGNNIG
jgi:Ran GTPase-activating protein (RanGAP) involved in mRNA processing and transport